VNGDYFKRFLFGELRQNRRHPSRQHCLPRARWADEQHIVTAGRSHFERALSGLLTDNVGEVSPVGSLTRCIDRGPSWRQLSDT
jgi:hypothetical protein